MTIRTIIEDLDDLVNMVNELKYSTDVLAELDIDDIKHIGEYVGNALSYVDEISYLMAGEDNE